MNLAGFFFALICDIQFDTLCGPPSLFKPMRAWRPSLFGAVMPSLVDSLLIAVAVGVMLPVIGFWLGAAAGIFFALILRPTLE